MTELTGIIVSFIIIVIFLSIFIIADKPKREKNKVIKGK